ncbi:hypothetical protein M569_17293, partial [Genlisea aurea]
MKGAVLVAIAAAVGNLLQGWDNATIAGAVLYVKREFHLESQPTVEGLIVATSLIGATFITTISGPASDSFGRRPMLLLSSILYFVSGIVMLWAPSVEILLLARLLDGFGIGLAVTLVPVYISETAPPEIRGTLNTLPQFTGSVGMFLSYCMVFTMSLMDSPSWRLMLGILSLPSVVYFFLAVFFLPESPRWLVSKGRMKEAKHVLTLLRGTEDVSGEMALLVEGLGVGAETSIEQYIITADNEDNASVHKDQIKLYGAEEGKSWMAKPVREPSTLAMLSRHGSVANPNVPLMDPMVTLFGSIHERVPQTGGSMLFPNFGSMFNMADQQHNTSARPENWDEENPNNDAGDRASDAGSGGDSDDDENNLRSPLLNNDDNGSEQLGGMGIGGGWQLAYRKDKKSKIHERIYLHQEPGAASGSMFSVAENESAVHAAALVSRSVLRLDDISDHHAIGKALEKQPNPSTSSWRDLMEPGVKHALFVGVGLQILQQFSGINGVLYYTPQILQQAGVGILLSNLGMSSDSSSLLISGVTTLLMLPSIGFAMRLMDIAGRRWLLLSTIPILLATLILLVVGNVVDLGSMVHAVVSTLSVIVYFCCFVMGFGPVPNILCAEIFPTRVRGLCIGICALTFWIGDIIVTYSLPVMLGSIGLAGVFGIYAAVCTAAWFFVFLKVPETKGMPLEVITDFFAVGARR